MPAHRRAFRPDIEGLRGVAILLVVLFHAGVPMLAGAFVGVDVFFVLSGFFITAPLVRAVAGGEGIDLSELYGRRALRLLPALLVVLLATLALVTWLYAPIDRAEVASNARAVAFSAGNIAFAQQSVNYFSSGENPLLHTWTLGVEQQFHLLWPLLLLLFAFLARAIARRRVARDAVAETGAERAVVKGLLIGIAVVGLLSFLFSLWLTSASRNWAFFGLPTRLWEFALGGIIAMVANERTGLVGEGKLRLALVLQSVGLALVAVATLSYSRGTPYPGFAALVPAFGAALLLVGGAQGAESPVGRALAARPLQWFGAVSYAWYLWHWPLMGLGAVLAGSIGVGGRLAWAGLALLLAWLTMRFVERPARNGRLRIPGEWLPSAALAASIVAALVAQGALASARRATAAPEQRRFAAARDDRMQHECWATTVDEPVRACEFGDTRSSTTIVLLGDSHAEHWLGGLDRVGRERGWKIVAMVKGGCPVADMSGLTRWRVARHFSECDRYREAMLRRIADLRPTAVLLSSWDHYIPADGAPSEWQTSAAVWQQGLRRTYSRLAAARIPVIAVRGTPRTWFDVPACLSRRAAGVPFAQTCDYDHEASRSRAAVAAQTAAARGLPVAFVDMNDQICATSRCPVVRNGVIVFTDDNHLTASFTRSLAPVLGERIQAAMGGGGIALRR